MLSIDINADLGESAERLENGADFELMRHITSASVACGGHAGDVSTIMRTLEGARQLGLAVGAHPGYPDKETFGRVELPLAPYAIEEIVRDQIIDLAEAAGSMGMTIAYVKPHGALYHAASRNHDVAVALARAVQTVDSGLVLIGQAGSTTFETWQLMGLRCAAEAFVDRIYEPDGSLRRRTLPGALIESPERALQQALDIILKRVVTLPNGNLLQVIAETICVHSDTPGAATIARGVREGLEAAGVFVQPLRRSSRNLT